MVDEGIQPLVAQREKFLSFVVGRVRDLALAEDLLQEAFSRAVVHHHDLREARSAEAWFYRLLRNTIIDHWRRVQAHARLTEELAHEAEVTIETPMPTAGRACLCVHRLLGELKPEYGEVLARVEVEGVPVKEFATVAGISTSNAGVRVHRAREALRRKVEVACGDCSDDGCRSCTCGA